MASNFEHSGSSHYALNGFMDEIFINWCNCFIFQATSDLQYNYHTILHSNIAIIMPVTDDLPVLGSNLRVKCLNLLICNNNSNSVLENFFTEQLFSLWTLPVVHAREVMLTLWARGLRGME